MARLNWMQMLAVAVAIVLVGPRVEAAAQTWSLDYPRGGEVFVIGTTQQVLLTGKIPATTVSVALSLDGTNFAPLGAGTITVVKGSAPAYSFTVAGPASSTCVIRVTANTKKGAVVVSSAPFSITAGTNLAAVSADTPNTLVLRDGSGNFAAGTITANLDGNASGTAANVTGIVAVANGGTGAMTAAAAFDALAPTNAKGDLIVRNSGTNTNLPVGGDGQVLIADSTQARGVKWVTVSGTGDGLLSGEVSGPLGDTVVGQVGGVPAGNVASGADLANAATSINIANTLVERDANGAFDASHVTFTATLSADALDAIAASGNGVVGSTNSANVNAAGVVGNFNAASANTGAAGVIGNCNSADGSGTGVAGVHNSSGTGVYGYSYGGTGVDGEVDLAGGVGVFGINTDPTDASGAGVVGNDSGGGLGVYGYSETGTGVGGESDSAGGTGVFGTCTVGGNGLVAEIQFDHTKLPTFSPTGNNCAVFQNYDTSGHTVTQVARIDGQGNIYCAGTVTTKSPNADVAEAFAVEGKTSSYEPGDVLMISTRSDCTVTKSDTSYSTRVMGVYASHPGVLLGTTDDDRVPLGVVGVIPTKVCSENGPIHRGDMLVSSSTPGHAMRGDPAKMTVGMVLGKALEDFTCSGVGKINVLVNVK